MFDIPKTMRAVVYRGIEDLRVETVPVPEIGAGELLVKVAVCGVCPTDIKKNPLRPPKRRRAFMGTKPPGRLSKLVEASPASPCILQRRQNLR